MELMFILILFLGLMLMKRHSPFSYHNTGVKAFGFDLQRFAITLPTNPSTSSAEVGKDFLLYVECDPAGGTNYDWVLVGGQRNSSLNRTADEIDVSHKGSGGWGSKKAGLRSWSIDLDTLVVSGDDGLDALDNAFQNGDEIHVKFKYPDGTSQEGWGSLTDYKLDPPHDGEASISGTISGNGALTDRAPGVSPRSATVSKAAAADKVFTISPTSATVSSVTDDGSALTVTTHYTYSGGTLTIKGSAYLATVAVGVHTFVVTTGDGATLAFKVTITA